jgi:uncharacterized protein (DUF1778 family)
LLLQLSDLYRPLATKICCNDIDITLSGRLNRRDGDYVMRQGPKRQSLNLRIKVEERGLIDRAAKTLGKNRTDFVLDAARRAAEDALLDRTIFTATPKAYAEFLARLDAPPQPNERLRKTLRTKAPWE